MKALIIAKDSEKPDYVYILNKTEIMHLHICSNEKEGKIPSKFFWSFLLLSLWSSDKCVATARSAFHTLYLIIIYKAQEIDTMRVNVVGQTP